ncbi:hypothetical protein NEOLEDRAFT_1150117 [Neolentinus lepideus HHB14362 ss-1]|uniref:RING-type domain-containing protein n=1 Tax=Neolentinus lepideus HHB14362 ss-1 TaxID=1314782 RepID=A0A165QDP0_9AGAM|nr:hypothetical protein NEOLEDRAFT_1150117 [Neolentinus lepideus HHB14362 ss-1]
MPGSSRAATVEPNILKRPSSVQVVDERPSKKSKTEESGERRDKKRRNKKKKKVPVVQHDTEEKTAEDNQSVASGSGSQTASGAELEATIATPSTIQSTFDFSPKYQDPTYKTAESNPAPTVTPGSLAEASSLPATSEQGGLNAAKGKEEVADNEELKDVVIRLTEELAAKAKLLSRYTSFLGGMQERLTCEICLDLLHKPYSLAPCGHVACENCLVSWFGAEVPEPAPFHVFRVKKCPCCREEITERPAMAWKIKDMVEVLVKSGLAENLVPQPEEPEPAPRARERDPWRGIFPSAFRRDNRHPNPNPYPNPNPIPLPILPHIGEMLPGNRVPVAAIPFPQAQAMLSAQQMMGALNAQMMGALDEADDGIYRCVSCHYEIVDGACAACGRLYPGHPHHPHADLHYNPEGYGDLDDLGDGSDSGESVFDEGHPPPLEWHFQFRPNENSADDLSQADDDEGPPLRYGLRAGQGEEEDEDEEDDEEYESSFIDDDDAGTEALANVNGRSPTRAGAQRGGAQRGGAQRGGTSWLASRARSGAPAPEERHSGSSPPGSSHSHGAGSSTGDVAGASSSSAGLFRGRRRTARFIESDDSAKESQSDSGSLAERVAARERAMYGDDGSVARHPRFAAASADEESDNIVRRVANLHEDNSRHVGDESDYGSDDSDREERDWGAVDSTVEFSEDEGVGFAWGDRDQDFDDGDAENLYDY